MPSGRWTMFRSPSLVSAWVGDDQVSPAVGVGCIKSLAVASLFRRISQSYHSLGKITTGKCFHSSARILSVNLSTSKTDIHKHGLSSPQQFIINFFLNKFQQIKFHSFFPETTDNFLFEEQSICHGSISWCLCKCFYANESLHNIKFL